MASPRCRRGARPGSASTPMRFSRSWDLTLIASRACVQAAPWEKPRNTWPSQSENGGQRSNDRGGGCERVHVYAHSLNAAWQDRHDSRMSNCEQRKMSESYKAIEVRKPGEFAEVRRPLQDPGLDKVRIRVEAWSVCHSATVEGMFPGITYPRVRGH